MFIFTMFFHLLTLPFVLAFMIIRMLFGLLGISTHILLIPLKIFARHTVLCIAIAAVLILYFALKKDPRPLDSLKPTPAESRQKKNPAKGAAPIIEPVSKYEDGDSLFATDTYQIMAPVERANYSNAFYTAMRSIPDGEEKPWSFYNIQGTFKLVSTFKNQKGTTCRKFTEVLKVHHIQQTISGTACDNGGGTWCKLKPNATPECGLGYSPGFVDGVSNSIKNLF